MAKNEFLRQDPKNKNRKLIYDLTNLIIPVLILIIGLFLFTQSFAEIMGYNPTYCDRPIYILKHTIGKYPAGYPIFNPIIILITMFRNPFDRLVQDAIAVASVPGAICAILSVFTWLIISIIRSKGFNKNEHLYGTSRWGIVKDLKKFGLCENHGVVLAMLYDAKTEAIINKKGNFGLKMIKPSKLICHAGTSHTLVIAPTRSGKGVGTVVPTLCSYTQSVIVFDPKGELYNMTAGYRQKFSRVIKFSPVQMETACFNPLEEVELDENAFRDIGTILTNIFQKGEKGGDSNSDFFDNNARDLLTGVIFHVLSAVDENGRPFYKKEEQCIAGILRIFARAASGTDEEGNPLPAGEALLDEMINSRHIDKNGAVSDYIHGIVLDVALSAKQQHEKVRSDIMQTVQSKLNLFRDPFIRHVTSHSDFKLSDFYESKEPISLYLTLPFGDVDRIMPVFQLIIDFIVRRFSSGELRAGEKEKVLKHPILFMIDEFPVLGNMKFLATSLGILAGYGLRFYLVVQAYQQLVKIYGPENTFIDNCRYILIYAPNNPQDAEKFSKMIGKKSVTKENLSISGSRYAVALNNLNSSSQEVAVDLINPDELTKLPYEDCIILGHNMPPYMGKKNIFYADERFSWKVFNENVDTGKVETGFAAPYTQKEIDDEVYMLPSQVKKRENRGEEEKKESVIKESERETFEKESFDPINFLETYQADENGYVEEWDAPMDVELDDGEPPPTVSPFSLDDFDNEGDVIYS
ncbi:type IV secretory system conjugative DNA transfer family protein [Treponema pectinovorum]|uniref:type IV secretory system conjugative DNA transfer family protein n=1 Tax=Treponema pectinovorum TaxID=164 RepID=UPI0011F3EB9F|nr:type IV secretory system conjugative DNA transfer family protein [Treponema pectinovorum]